MTDDSGRLPRLFVTGARGYIGKRFAEIAQSRGFDVKPFDALDGQDILDREALLEAVRDADVVVNLAAIGDIYEVQADPKRALGVNMLGAERVGEACLAAGVRLIHASTCCVYGTGNGTPIDEDTAPAPTEVYAAQKLEAEGRLTALAGRGLKLVIARLATAYGGEMRQGSVFRRLLESATRREPFPVHGDGQQRRAYTHVDDLCRALLVLASNPSRETVYNVCGPREVSVKELVELVERVSGVMIHRMHLAQRDGQILRQPLRADRLRREFGWAPSVSLEDGLRQMYADLSKATRSETWHEEVPCLHRVHESEPTLDANPAHWIHWRMGLSMGAKELIDRLARLHERLDRAQEDGASGTRCLVTFDDGYRDVLGLRDALRKMDRIQPVLFVPTSILEGETNWFDSYYALLGMLPEAKLRSLWMNAEGGSAVSDGLWREELLLSLATGSLKKRLKSMTHGETIRELRSLWDSTGFDPARLDQLYLTERDLRQLEREGWFVASHGHYHQNATLLGQTNLDNELRTSLGRVLELGGRAWLAYPDGKWNDGVLTAARRMHYTLAFTLGGVASGQFARSLWLGSGNQVATRASPVSTTPNVSLSDVTSSSGPGASPLDVGSIPVHQ